MFFVLLTTLFSGLAFAETTAPDCINGEVFDEHLPACIEQLTGKITDLDNQIRSVENALDMLSKRSDASTPEVSSALNALKTEKKADVEVLRAEIQEITTRLTELEARLAELTTAREAEKAAQRLEKQETEIAECIRRNYARLFAFEEGKQQGRNPASMPTQVEDCRPQPTPQTSWRDQNGGSTWSY
jgi:seryl-tRNA synthetase